MSELPFQIEPTLSGCGLVTYTAVVEDKPITSERYAPGDGEKRRKTAARWATDDRLRNGHILTVKETTAALESAEHKARGMQAAGDDDGDDGGDPQERASYVDDCIIVELAWNRETGRADFIIFDRDSHTIDRCEEIETANGIIVVPSFWKGIVTPGEPIDGSVLVPTDADETGEDETDLRRNVQAFIERYVELPIGAVSIAVEYVFLTWVHDAFSELPYLAFRTADYGRGKSRALDAIGTLCYRPLIVGGGSSAAAMLRMLDIFGGTLVADEFDQSKNSELGAALNQILNQGFQTRRPLVKCDGESNTPRPFRCFGPKVFALRQRLGDDATESRTLSITMRQRTRADIPLNLPIKQFDSEAILLRNRLLYWRFVNLDKVALDPSLADPELEDRANQIGLPLLAVARTADTRAAIVEGLKAQQENVAADRAETWVGELFAAVLRIGHLGDTIRPRDVAAEVNRARAEATGVDLDKLRRPMTPSKAGHLLRIDLELPREPKDKHGARYRLEPNRLKQLCERFGEDYPFSDREHSKQASPPSHRHPSPGTSPENPLFDSASGVGDGGDGGDGHQEAPGLIGDGDTGDTPKTKPTAPAIPSSDDKIDTADPAPPACDLADDDWGAV